MEKQQKQKLAVAIIFLSIILGMATWAYITILLPNREYRKRTGEKYTQKLQYKTKYNPDFVDSVIDSKEKSSKPIAK